MDYLNAALAFLQLGDETSYMHLREEMAVRFKNADDWIAERILVVGLMRSLDDRTTAHLQPWASLLDRTVASGNEPPSYLPLLGLLDYRGGDYAKAMEWARRSVSKFSNVAQPHAMARIILAMSLHQLGDLSAAHLELDQAKHLAETGFDLEFDMWWWRSWVLVRLLLLEADRLLPPTPPTPPLTVPR
jgi:hypothetical protein